MEQEARQASLSAVLLFTDVVGSTDLKSRHGTLAYAKLLRRHNQLFEDCCKPFEGHQILKHTGDGYFATFATASDAVRFALLFQAAMRDADWKPEPLRTRVGIHAGEVAVMTMIGKADVVGYAADVAARVMSLGEGGQILLTRSVFDDARQFVDEHPVLGEDPSPPKIRWLAHGAYLFKGSDLPLEVFEVGAEGVSPLRPPPDAEKAKRVAPESEKRQLGWRPARGQTIPNRPDWRLSRRLRSDAGEESWVGTNKATGEKRTFRFLFDDAKTYTVRDVQTVAPTDPQRVERPVLDSQLDDAPAFIAVPAGEDAADDPGWVGPYRVIGRVGEGGMGIVYRAEQRDPIRREVALKLIKLGMDSRDVLARFDTERQALALMNHPGIARVLDAGISDAGRPYFAMEYIAGERITDYCDRQQLTTRQRLELFDKVCDAVQHAHSKGVIHRDLKPSNILVTIRDGVPTPVIIDFGVAKATNQRLTEHSVFTERGQLIGTPEYMSPEQAEMSAVDIDTRTDIYSLGVILYELLIGALPFEATTLRSAAYAEIQRIIREVDPPRMSTRLSALGERAGEVARRRSAATDALAREVRGELEWIPLCAMRKDRTERYRTAAELGDDVRNYLTQRPLRAGPESSLYRLKKFVRRNRSRSSAPPRRQQRCWQPSWSHWSS